MRRESRGSDAFRGPAFRCRTDRQRTCVAAGLCSNGESNAVLPLIQADADSGASSTVLVGRLVRTQILPTKSRNFVN